MESWYVHHSQSWVVYGTFFLSSPFKVSGSGMLFIFKVDTGETLVKLLGATGSGSDSPFMIASAIYDGVEAPRKRVERFLMTYLMSAHD